MSTIVNMRDAKTSLSKLVRALETGHATEFIIARAGRPAARLVPLQSASADRDRRIGVAKGRFDVPDDIDQSEKEVAELFGIR